MVQWLRIRLPPMWPGFNSQAQHQMWVEFVVGSHPCSERFFSGYSGFPLSSKSNISKFQFDLEFEGHRFVSRTACQSYCMYLFYFFYLFSEEIKNFKCKNQWIKPHYFLPGGQR